MVKGKLFYLVFLLVIGLGQIGISQTYNPTLTISNPSTIADNGYVTYSTSALTGDARFTMFGNGYFGIRNNFSHQFQKDTSGFTTTTFFNRKYKKVLPTKKLISTGQTGTGTSSNSKIFMSAGSNSRVGTSWSPCKGIENYFLLIFENTASVIDSGCIEFYYHNLQLGLNSTDILENNWVSNKAISGITGSSDYNQKIQWKFKNLMPGEQRVVYIPMTSKVRAGTKLTVGSKYISNCTGSSSTTASGVTGSSIYSAGSPHDPNSKVADRELIHTAYSFQQTITYTVRFQNEGNAPAIDVLLRDELNDQYLDLSTLEFIDSEYNYTYSLTGNVLEVFFPNINLPGSKQSAPKTYAYDDTESFIQFQICTHPELPQDLIHNYVEIYFDTQPAVLTNVSTVAIVDSPLDRNVKPCVPGPMSTNVAEFSSLELKVTPNPVDNILFIEGIESEEFDVNIYNHAGKLVKSKTGVNKERNSIQLTYLPSGMYFVQLKNEKINVTKKVIKL